MPGSHEHDHAAREGLHIVVGYDGSTAARRALEQAAFDAGPLGMVFVAASGSAAPDLLAGLERDEIPALSRTQWRPEVLDGPPGKALVRLAGERNADRIHLGTRGTGRTTGAIGSVAQRTIELADRPVLVFPERAVAREAARPHVAV